MVIGSSMWYIKSLNIVGETKVDTLALCPRSLVWDWMICGRETSCTGQYIIIKGLNSSYNRKRRYIRCQIIKTTVEDNEHDQKPFKFQ